MKVAVNKATVFENEQFESTLGFVHHCQALNSVFLYYTDGQLLRYNQATQKPEGTSVKLPKDLTRFRIGALADTKLWILDGNERKLRIFNLADSKFEAEWPAPSAVAKTEYGATSDETKVDELLMDTKVLALPENGIIVTMERCEKNNNEATYIFTAYDPKTDAKGPGHSHKIQNNKNFLHFDVVDTGKIAIFAQEIEVNAPDVPVTIWTPVTRKEKTVSIKNQEKIVGTIVNVKQLVLENGKARLAFFVNTESQDATKQDEAILMLNEEEATTFESIVPLKNEDPVTKALTPCLIHNVIRVYPKDHTLLAKIVEEDGNKIILYNYAKRNVLAAFKMDDETDASFSMAEQTLIQSPQILADPPRSGAGSKQETSFLTTLFIPKEILSIFYMLNAREKETGPTLEDHYKGINIISDAYNLLAEKKANILL